MPTIKSPMPEEIAREILGVQPLFSPFPRNKWPYQVDLYDYMFSQSMLGNTDFLKNINEWCLTNIEPGEWDRKSQFLAFKNEKDYMWFKLTWL